MGLAEQALQRWVEAEQHLAEALRARNDAWIRRNRSVLESSLRTVRGKVGRLEVDGAPEGADVFVNGRNVGRLPLSEPVIVPPGSVRLEVRAGGHATAAMTVAVGAGQQGRVDVRLERERTAVSPPPPVAAAPLPAPPPPPPPVERPTPDEPAPPSTIPTLRWVALGATGAALAVGVTGVLLHQQKISDFNAEGCGIDRMGMVAHQDPAAIPACRSTYDAAQTRKTIGIAGLVGAGVLAATSAVLFFAF